MSSPLECCLFGPQHSEMVAALETRPSCARLGQPGAAVPTQPLVPVPTRAGAVMEVTIFCEIRIPISGSADVAMIMKMLSELQRLLQ
jgi:hypothetical protein